MAGQTEISNMALFCDFENVALGVRDAKYAQFDIKKVLERLLLNPRGGQCARPRLGWCRRRRSTAPATPDPRSKASGDRWQEPADAIREPRLAQAPAARARRSTPRKRKLARAASTR